jgi:integrase
MSISPASRNPADRPTFATLHNRISADETLGSRRRQDVNSAIRTVAKALGRSLDDLPADPADLRARLRDFAPAAAGLSLRRWRNALSLLRYALKHSGLTRVPARSRAPLTCEWEDLFRHLNDRRSLSGLSRFGRYCSVRAIAPCAVDDSVLDVFLSDLRDGALVRTPGAIHRTTCVLWNKAAASIACWPDRRLVVRDRRQTFALPWCTYPASLKIDVDRYLERLAGKDPLAPGDFRPLRPISVENRAKLLRAFVAALVHRGRDPQSIATLRDVVAVDAITDGLRFFLDRANGQKTSYIHEIAHVLTAVARHWVLTDTEPLTKADQEHLNKLDAICKRLRRLNRNSMSAKTRGRLRPLADAANARALLEVPQRLLAAASAKHKTPRRAALEVQTALAIEFLLMVPLRIGNLANLNIERHLIRARGGMMHLAIPGAEVKNSVDIDPVLPVHFVRMIETYLKKYRPVLTDQPSAWLYPGMGGKPIGTQSLGKRMREAVKRLTGLDVNPHLYRSIAGTLYLDKNPGAYGVIRLLLGHKSVNTTTQFYCGMETPAAFRHYDEHILERREASPAKRAGRKGTRR